MAAGSLQIDVLANTQKLIKGMNKAEATVQNAAKGMKLAIGGFAAIFVSGKLINGIQTTSAEIDKLGKTSARLGIGTDKLAGLQFAAEQSGVAVDTLNMALQRQTRRVAEAAQGTGEAVKALDELGLSAENLNQLSPDEQMNKIADAMGNVENQSDKVRLAMKLWDSEGVALINMLQGGSQALNDYYKEAVSLGIALDESLVRKVEAANDANDKLSKSLSVISTELNVRLAPYMIYAANTIVELVRNFQVAGKSSNIFGSVIQGTARAFIIAFQSMRTATDGWTVALSFLNLAIQSNFSKSAKDIKAAEDAFQESARIADESAKEWIRALNGTDQVTLNLLKALSEINANFANVKRSGSDSMNDLTDNTKQANEALKSTSSIVGSQLTSSLRRSMDESVNFGETMKMVAKDVVSELINILFVQEAINAAVGAYGGGGATSSTALTSADYAAVNAGGSQTVGALSASPAMTKSVSMAAPALKSPSANVNVFNNTNSEVSVQESDGQIDIIIESIANGIQRGISPVGNAIESRYGVSKQ